MRVINAYVALTKPRIIELLLVTTVPMMFLASGTYPDGWLVAWTMIGGYFAAGSANTFNNIVDADIDNRMRRTRKRPMAQAQVGKTQALVFGIVLAIASALVLGFGANWLSAGLALLANAFYVFIYTLWLKRNTWQNIVWGGIAGCFPPLIGWTAVTDRLDWAPIIAFLIVFFWTPPHTWALAIRYKDDYHNAGVPMLPVVKPPKEVAAQILIYTVATAAVSMLLWPVAHTGWLYPLIAGVVGVVFIVEAVRLYQRASRGLDGAELRPMRLFHWSNSYLALVFVAMAIDPVIF